MIVAVQPKWQEERRRLRPLANRDNLSVLAREASRYLPPELAGEMLDLLARVVVLKSRLHVVVYRGPLTAVRGARPGDREIVGVTSRKLITDTGVAFLVDAWQNSVELEIMKFHALGTGTNAEAAGNTALQTELTTQYNPDNTRATGTLTESAANIFQTVGVNTLDGAATVQEHMILSVATVGSGVGWDRSLTGGQALSASDSLQSTYSMTATSGG
jgi:hypothetical protein